MDHSKPQGCIGGGHMLCFQWDHGCGKSKNFKCAWLCKRIELLKSRITQNLGLFTSEEHSTVCLKEHLRLLKSYIKYSPTLHSDQWLLMQSISWDVADNVSHPRRLDLTMELITYSFVLYLQHGRHDVKCKPSIHQCVWSYTWHLKWICLSIPINFFTTFVVW